MANVSILAAFERMWQHIVSALGNKADIAHTHNFSDIKNYETNFLYSSDLTVGSSDGVDLTGDECYCSIGSGSQIIEYFFGSLAMLRINCILSNTYGGGRYLQINLPNLNVFCEYPLLISINGEGFAEVKPSVSDDTIRIETLNDYVIPNGSNIHLKLTFVGTRLN